MDKIEVENNVEQSVCLNPLPDLTNCPKKIHSFVFHVEELVTFAALLVSCSEGRIRLLGLL